MLAPADRPSPRSPPPLDNQSRAINSVATDHQIGAIRGSPSTIENFAATGRLDPAAREALRPSPRPVKLEQLGLPPRATAALRRYREDARLEVPAVGRGLSPVDRLLVHAVAALGMSSSAVATALGASPHLGVVALRLAASALAGFYRSEREAVFAPAE